MLQQEGAMEKGRRRCVLEEEEEEERVVVVEEEQEGGGGGRGVSQLKLLTRRSRGSVSGKS
jgi:hypothetical protein